MCMILVESSRLRLRILMSCIWNKNQFIGSKQSEVQSCLLCTASACRIRMTVGAIMCNICTKLIYLNT